MKQTRILLLTALLSLTNLFPFTVLGDEVIAIRTKDTELVLRTDEHNYLYQVYFGERLDHPEQMHMTANPARVYPAFGTSYYNEAALHAVHADGNTSTELAYTGHVVEEVQEGVLLTTIDTRDTHYPFFVRFFYQSYYEDNVIEQWVEIRHQEEGDVMLYQFASAHLHFNEPVYHVTQFHGNWADEMHMVENKLTRGQKVLDSKLGIRSNQFAHSHFLLSLDGPALEDAGRVVGGTLAWPGSHRILFDVDEVEELQLIAGINPHASWYRLEKDEVFETPALLYTFSAHGTGEVSRNFHRWAMKHGVYRGDRTRLTLLNNWEATYFDFNQELLSEIIGDAAEMDFELFLLDDGWFGTKHPRNSDHAGLGDWEVNREKLPDGIGYLVEESHKNGIRFGLWLEPEMVNPRSELYENHPDWVIGQPYRDLHLLRNQLNLDLANPEVRDFVFGVVDRYLSDYPGISYIKWDANRFITNPGSYYLPPQDQSHLWIENVRGLMSVLERVREKHPEVFMMVCSGGGGRLDYATLPYFDEFWISDNTDALSRVFIQWGTTFFYPAMALASHVSVVPNHITQRITPLKFRFDVAMSAKLGMDLQPRDMSPEEKAFSKNAIQEYYKIRDIVQFGELYRLLSPYTNDRAAMMYVSDQADRAVVFAYQLKKAIQGNKQPLVLKGLDPDKNYLLREVNKDPGSYSWFTPLEGKVYSGDFLMKYGLRFVMYNEYDSKIIELTAQP
jgi:alpha-galactosidase